jgi:hypothetical protein
MAALRQKATCRMDWKTGLFGYGLHCDVNLPVAQRSPPFLGEPLSGTALQHDPVKEPGDIAMILDKVETL